MAMPVLSAAALSSSTILGFISSPQSLGLGGLSVAQETQLTQLAMGLASLDQCQSAVSISSRRCLQMSGKLMSRYSVHYYP